MPGSSAEKLNPVDASFLHLEERNTHMHIGGVCVFDPSAVGGGEEHYQALIHELEPRLDAMPRYRQKLAFVPLRLDTPVWVDDADFDIHNHVIRAALPAPGGDRELQQYVSRVYSRQLDRRRPLWELYVIEGLSGGRWALLTKTHHAMVDGISNVELITALFDTSSQVPNGSAQPSTWQPDDSPSSLSLLVGSLTARATRPVRAVSAARAVVGNPRGLAAALRDTASGLAAVVGASRAPKGVLNGRTGPTREWVYTRCQLEDFRTVKGVFGGTINDVVLAAVAGGLRRYLIAHDIDPAEESIQALCPVSLRDPSQSGALGNKLAMLLVRLPVAEADPARRLARVRETVDAMKARKQAVGADFLLNLVGFAPSTLHAMAARASLSALPFNLIVTNVPGPQIPLYCLGSKMAEAFPAAFLYQGQRLAIAIFSYCGMLNVGLIADAAAMPDVDLVAEDVGAGLEELVAAARVEAGLEAPTRKRSTRKASTSAKAAATTTRKTAAGKRATSKTAAATTRKPATSKLSTSKTAAAATRKRSTSATRTTATAATRARSTGKRTTATAARTRATRKKTTTS